MKLSNEILVTTTSGSQSCHISVWDLSSCSPLIQMRDEAVVASGTLCPLRQEYLYAGVKGKPLLYRWCLTNGQRSKVLKTQSVPGHISALATTTDGLLLSAAIDEKIFVWQCNSGDLLAVLSGPSMQTICQLAFLDPPSLLVSASKDGMLAVWSVGSIRSLYSGISQPNVEPVFTVSPCASPVHFDLVDIITDTLIVTASEDGHFAVYSIKSGRQVEDSSMPSPFATRPMFCVSATMSGELICCGSTNGVLLSSSILKRHPDYFVLREHRVLGERENTPDNPSEKAPGDLTCLSLSPSGQALACGTRCGNVVLVGLPDFIPYNRLRVDGPLTNLHILWRPPWIEDIELFRPITCLTHPLRREPGLQSSFMFVRPKCDVGGNVCRLEDLSWWSSGSQNVVNEKASGDETLKNTSVSEHTEKDAGMSVAEIRALKAETEQLRDANKKLHRKLLETIPLTLDSAKHAKAVVAD